jgi:hypothetical protein
MEFDRQTDRLPFHDPDEAEQARGDAAAPSHDSRIRHLRRVPLFSGFNENELRRVAELSRIVEVPAGTVVTQIGEPGDSFFIIIDGAVAVRTPVGAGSELHPGDFFGEMSLVDGEPRSATIVATTDLRFLIVDRSHFWRLLDEAPGFGQADSHDPVTSRATSRADGARDTPWHESDLTPTGTMSGVQELFGSIHDARANCHVLSPWHHTEPHHLGLGQLTPPRRAVGRDMSAMWSGRPLAPGCR